MTGASTYIRDEVLQATSPLHCTVYAHVQWGWWWHFNAASSLQYCCPSVLKRHGARHSSKCKQKRFDNACVHVTGLMLLVLHNIHVVCDCVAKCTHAPRSHSPTWMLYSTNNSNAVIYILNIYVLTYIYMYLYRWNKSESNYKYIIVCCFLVTVRLHWHNIPL